MILVTLRASSVHTVTSTVTSESSDISIENESIDDGAPPTKKKKRNMMLFVCMYHTHKQFDLAYKSWKKMNSN